MELESCSRAALRLGVEKRTLARWLRAAGLASDDRPWRLARPAADAVVARRLAEAARNYQLARSLKRTRDACVARPPLFRRSTKNPVYHTWHDMHRRCTDSRRPEWKNYGGRGIRVCDEWSDFEVFARFMGERPPGMTIERIDNNGNYEPGNVKWATRAEQSLNRRVARLVTIDGVTRTMSEWSRRTGVQARTIRHRLRSGWDMERAITEPAHTKSRFRGATWHKQCRKWQAMLRVNGRALYLGLHATEQQAAAAYNAAAALHLGPRAANEGKR